jgi:hypothetical protein
MLVSLGNEAGTPETSHGETARHIQGEAVTFVNGNV